MTGFPKLTKRTKEKKPLKRKSKTPLAKAKERAWSAFSLYIRNKYADNEGLVSCYTCGKRLEIKSMQAGHGIGGRNNAILFEERVVRPQEMGCNVYGRGQYAIFTRKLIDELGLEEYDQIVTQSRTPLQYKTQDYLDIEAKYAELLKNL